MSETIYRLERVEKHYAGRAAPAVAIHETLSIRRGEILVLVGPSGAGKSTLLRLLALVEPPTKGALEFLGERLHNHTAATPTLALRRRVVLLFQRPILLNESVARNVAYGLQVRGRKNISVQVERALALVHLSDLRDAPARTLSGGEAQRVALARALVIEPDVLLLDEPTANLDPYNVSLIEQIVQTQHQQHGTTFVIVTHNIFQARRLATRAALLLNGNIVEIGSGDDFFEHPRDPRTRAFVRGEMVY